MDIPALLAEARVNRGLDTPSISVGLAPVTDWGTARPFLDLMKEARPFFGSGADWNTMANAELAAQGLLDENGWPTAIPPGSDLVRTVWVWKTDLDAAEYRQGTYVLTYEGEGEIELSLGATIVHQEPGRIVFDNPKGGTFSVGIVSTDPNATGDYIRDISVVREDQFELHEAGAVFNPEWLARVADFETFRFMDWMTTNHEPAGSWADRPRVEDTTWTKGVPLEIMVQLANEAGVDPWFTIPHNASREYIENSARYVFENLDPGLVAHVELSNELWNTSFKQHWDYRAAGAALWGEDSLRGALNYSAKRAVETAQIWTRVFGDEAETRLERVLSTHRNNPWATQNLLEAPLWKADDPAGYVRPADMFDSLGVTTYFGVSIVADRLERTALLSAIASPTVDATDYLYKRLLNPAVADSVADAARKLEAQKALADGAGLTLRAYEGGQHVHHSAFLSIPQEELDILTEFMSGFVRSPEMARLYELSIENWRAVSGESYMQFGDVNMPSKYGAWSIWNDLLDESPVSRVIEKANETGLSSTNAARHHGVQLIGRPGNDTLTGTTAEDYLIGSKGRDVLVGGPGNDVLSGGAGMDQAVFSGHSRDYKITSLGADEYRVEGPDGSDRLIGVEQLVFEIDGVQNLGTSTPGPIDVIDGGASTGWQRGVRVETINQWSELGREIGIGEGGASGGYVVYAKDSAAEFASGRVAASYFSTQENRAGSDGPPLTSSAIKTALTLGSLHLDVSWIAGTEANDSFQGREGPDFFRGLGGDDYLNGGPGDDTLRGGDGKDGLYGGRGADRLNGGSGDDRLVGGPGDDWLEPESGNDILIGGSGRDVFAFRAAKGDQVVTDFEPGDQLRFKELGFADADAVRDQAGLDAAGNLRFDLEEFGSVTLDRHGLDALSWIDIVV